MIFNGIQFKKSNVYGWRPGDPTVDMDGRGNPIQSNYIVLVRITDCPVLKKNDEWVYTTAGVKQAFPITHGGTNYGYGKPKVVRGQGRNIRVNRDGKAEIEWLTTYVKTPVYLVNKGSVYVGAVYRELKAGEQ